MKVLLRLGVALIVLALIIAAVLFWPRPLHSQPSARCAPLPLFEYAMERIAEQLMAVGIAGTSGQTIRFYVNPVERGWTVLAIDGAGMACKVVEGTAFDFAKPKPRGEPIVGEEKKI